MSAYFDESGTHQNSSVMNVSGYLFDPTQAAKFDEEWRRALADFSIDVFHMQDCAHGTGEFMRLSRAQRSELARKLIGIISLRARVGFSVSLPLEAFSRLKPAEWKRGGPYTLCVFWCLSLAMTWAETVNSLLPISYYFESGDEFEGATNKGIWMFRQDRSRVARARMNSHNFISKTDAPHLQAADLLAWEMHQQAKRKMGLIRKPERASLAALGAARPHWWMEVDEGYLESFFTIEGRRHAGEVDLPQPAPPTVHLTWDTGI